MIAITLDAVAQIVGGELLDDAAARATVAGVTIDSRTAGDGALFVALPGEHTDGHKFVADALRRGAVGALVERPTGGPGEIVVDDVADALLGLGAWVRATVDPTVVAVTGSSGKTTTKDLIRSAVAINRRVIANVGSYNNELGVPLTCCELRPDTQVLVAEVGARGVGHIAAMAEVLRPDVSVVTNVGAAHLEMFRDVEGVARAKAELVEALDAEGVAVLNADEPLVADMASATKGRVVTYGTAHDADVRATDITFDDHARPSFTVDGIRVTVPLPGAHNIANGLAALAAAHACGVPLASAADGLRRAAVSRWRMELLTAPSGLTVLNDAYNANPSSMTAALRTLSQMGTGGRRWAVLGHMAELGAGGDEAHRRIGRLCAELDLDALVVVGETAAGIHEGATAEGFRGFLTLVDTPDDAVAAVTQHAAAADLVLVKASRSVGLERVAVMLAEQGAAA